VSIDSALALAKRLKRERQARDLPPVILIIGCPEASRLGFDLASERQALIRSNVGAELFEAEAMESTKAFHVRLCAIARSRNVHLVSVGSDQPMLESRYNLDGSVRVLN
jgi:hypothetical protein